jgi:hypothetical protein
MQEIWIPELLACFFLLLALIQPLVRTLKPSRGLVWLPLPAFFIAIGLFPAYGFRPEALPLVVLSIIITIIRLPRILSTLGKGDIEYIEYTEREIFRSFSGIVLLCAALAVIMVFSPVEVPAYGRVYTFPAKDGGGREYFFRVYRGQDENVRIDGEKKPLLVLIPPLYGSVGVLENLCGELLKRNFTVLTYSRRGFDAPALDGEKAYGVSPPEWFRRGRAFLSGTGNVRDNERGRLLEKERKDDVLFVLSQILRNPRLDEGLSLFDIAGRDSVFLGAYDAGASALLMLSGDRDFVRNRPFIKGIIAVEPPLWSLFTEEVREYEEPPPGASWFRRLRAGLGRRLDSLKSKKTVGPAAVPRPGYPLLIAASDRVLDDPPARRYEAVRLYLQASGQPVVLAAMDGAGPLDYSDFPLKYPLISAFFPGRKREAFDPREAAGGTAAIIARFAFRVLEAEVPAFRGLYAPPELPANVRIESNNSQFTTELF